MPHYQPAKFLHCFPYLINIHLLGRNSSNIRNSALEILFQSFGFQVCGLEARHGTRLVFKLEIKLIMCSDHLIRPHCMGSVLIVQLRAPKTNCENDFPTP